MASPTLRSTEAPTEILPTEQLPRHAATSPSPITSTQKETASKQSLLPWLIAGILAIAFIIYLAILKGATPNNSNNLSASSDNQTANTNQSDSVLSNTSPVPDDRFGDPRSKPAVTNTEPEKGDRIGMGPGAGIGQGDSTINTDNKETKKSEPSPQNNNTVSPKETAEDYNRIFSSTEVTQKARILSRPEPQYTEEARRNQVSGTVLLRAVFLSNGEVTDIHAVSGLPYGLTERAMAAARLIKFSPAMKDGHPVSQQIQIEYNFNLY